MTKCALPGLVLGIAAVACSTEPPKQSVPAPMPEPAAQPTPAVSWSRSEYDEHIRRLVDALNGETASFPEVLEFTVEALKGLDPTHREARSDGSAALKVRARDGADVGVLRVLPAAASGVRSMELSMDTAAHDEFLRFDDKARATLEVRFGCGASAPEFFNALTKTEFKPSTLLLRSITEERPLSVGGSLLVDRAGNCTSTQSAIHYSKAAKDGPPWQTIETPAEPCGTAALADPKVAELQRLLESLGKP